MSFPVRITQALAGGMVLWIASTTLLAGATNDLPITAWQGNTMGSTYTVKIAGVELKPDQLERVKAEIEGALTEVNRQMSHYQPDSELSRFNRTPAGAPFKVSPDFARVASFAREIWDRSGGAFDPTLGPVINLWGFGEKHREYAVPSAGELKEALDKTGCKRLRITAHNELIKSVAGLQLNLSAVAKGFGTDQMVAVLQRHGYTNAYAAIAGDVRVLGKNARGTPWQVGISVPIANWREQDPTAAVVALSDQAISTSGDYQKFFFDSEGRRVSHIFDPRTGWPVQHAVGGVSVVAGESMTADALSTTLFVLGLEEGLRFIEQWTNAAALFIVREEDGGFRQVSSSRFFQLTGYQP